MSDEERLKFLVQESQLIELGAPNMHILLYWYFYNYPFSFYSSNKGI